MSKSFKDIFCRFIDANETLFKNKRVVDFPAGSGYTTQYLEQRKWGTEVLPFDLFPEFFKYEKLTCRKADAVAGLPLDNHSVDVILCQEGIEHFSDQLKSLRNFSKVLKNQGTLLLSTPNYSNMTSRLSYLLTESERFNRYMAPNEIDSVWFNQNKDDNEVYLGHVFLLGIQKLRFIAKVAGFDIKQIYFSEFKLTAFFWFLLFYPFIFLSNTITYLKNVRKNPSARNVYKEVYLLGINPKILIDGSLIVEFVKVREPEHSAKYLRKIGGDDFIT